jgi:anhydro-N-acetylmuramic acid kinase
MSKKIYIGAMTGTSHDAIDISFLSIGTKINLEYFHSIKFPKSLRLKVKKLIENNESSLSDLGTVNKEIGFLFSKSINEAIGFSKIKKSSIECVAISGQTIRHEINKRFPFSMQIGDPNIVAKETGLLVVSDFRNMHIALGGEGAPLVPEFHNQLFYKARNPRIILNIGGISNYSFVKNRNDIWGTDVGPGNAILDAYCSDFLQIPFDKNGAIAAKGKVDHIELGRLLQNSFFKKSFPKSTGKELFNLNLLSKKFLGLPSEDVLATLAEFTAESFALAIKKNNHLCSELIVCGGGSKNEYLLGRIKKLLNVNVMLSNQLGVDAQSIESMAFAWLGYKRINEENLKIQLSANKFTRGLLGSVVKSKR